MSLREIVEESRVFTPAFTPEAENRLSRFFHAKDEACAHFQFLPDEDES